MTKLPSAVHGVEQLRQLDRNAIERMAVPGYTLMCRAGAAAVRVLRNRWPEAKRITIVCGSGNNGGDGYVVARLAKFAGLSVTVIAMSDTRALRGDALKAYSEFVALGGKAVSWDEELVADTDVIVDAILGIGLSRPVDSRLSECIRALNASPAPILALDIPSGIDATTGLVLGEAVRADCTITFIGLKLGFYVGVAADYLGALEFDDLEISPVEGAVGSDGVRLDSDWLGSAMPKRSRLAHKGTNGHVLLIGGGRGMAGAARLTGEACLRVGAGLVTVATCAENVSSIVIDRPELIVRAIASASELRRLIDRADVIAIGPGLGQDDWAQSLFIEALSSGKQLVVDADALNLLAKNPERRENWILTPHPGEAGRLIQLGTNAVQADRLAATRSLIQRFGGTVVLKGTHTLIARRGELSICDQGNPAMATPGMGDVLTGVIAGLLAQWSDSWLAARAGVIAHAWAGDLAAGQLARLTADGTGKIERGVLASDLFAFLPHCVSSNE